MPIDPNFDFALGDADAYRAELMADAEQVVARSAGPLDEENQEAFDALVAEIERTDQDIKNRRNIEALGRKEETSESAFELPQVNVNLKSRADVWDSNTLQGLNGSRLSRELYSRARVVIEEQRESGCTDDAKQDALNLIEHDPAQFDKEGNQASPAGGRARHILTTSSPQYLREWHDYLENPMGGPSKFLSQARTAMSEGSTAVGGAIVPYFLDPTIHLTNAGVVSPIRRLATVKQSTTNIWHGVTSAGVTAEWIGEATEVADASPSFAQPTITTYKADAYVQASMELIADAALSGEIAGLLGEAKGRLEGTAFAVGTGTAQPRGMITASSGGVNQIAGSSGASTAADLVAADIYATANALPARYRATDYGANPAWLASYTVLNKIRALNTGTTAYQSTFWTDFNGPTPPKLIGFPIFEVSDMDSTIVSGSTDVVLLFGDISQYYIVDRIGMELVYNPLVLGSNRRPTGESAWVAFWRQGADTVYSAAFRTLRL